MFRKVHARIANDTFLKHNVVFFASSMVIAFVNYLFYPIVGRLMSVSDFGEVQVIFSLVLLSSVLLTVFRLIVINLTANKDGSLSNHTEAISRLYTLAIALHLPFIILILVGSPIISQFFSFNTHWSFIPFALAMVVSVPLVFTTSVMQGRGEFTTLSIANSIQAATKLFFAFILVYLGTRVFGAVSALVLSSLLGLVYILRHSGPFPSLRLSGPFFSFSYVRKLVKELHSELRYGTLIFVSLGVMTFLYSGDVLFAKKYFDPETAGLYGGIATISRIIFFGTASFSGVHLASVKLRGAARENLVFLKKAIIFVSVLGGIALVAFSIWPEFFISLLIGKKYLSLAPLLPLFSLYIFIASLANLLVAHLIALRSLSLIPISLVCLMGTLVLIVINHATPQDIVIDFTIGVTVYLAILTVVSFRNQKVNESSVSSTKKHLNCYTAQ